MDLKLEGSYKNPIELKNISPKKVDVDSGTKKEKYRNGIEIKSPMMEAMSLLDGISDVRTEKIALGQKLITRPDYPDDETFEKVADALLGNIDICDE